MTDPTSSLPESEHTARLRSALYWWWLFETGWYIGWLWKRRLDWWMWLVYGHRHGTRGRLVLGS